MLLLSVFNFRILYNQPHDQNASRPSPTEHCQANAKDIPILRYLQREGKLLYLISLLKTLLLLGPRR